MKEIGGYLELEQFTGQEYYSNMVKLNLGRTALLYLLKLMKTRVLWVPSFLCDSVTGTCLQAGYQLKYYPIDQNFLPVLDKAMEPDECLYLVNFYGQLAEDLILRQKEKYGRVILDNTHAFFQKPIPGVPALYSLRKFFGLSDGAYVFTADLPVPSDQIPEQDISCGRMGHILGRYEENASAHYQTMLKNAHAFNDTEIKRMSRLTENLLHAIDYDRIRRTREENYKKLEELLGPDNLLPRHMPDGPFTYPCYHRNGLKLRRKMAQYKIYVPTYWNNILTNLPEDSLEYNYAANILPLPCDQRYTTEDMEHIADIFRQCTTELENNYA